MLHLGDITKIDGYTVPIVDVVVGGSPCQDLSVAGKRAGLDGERSGLFMEQLRIIKEMRENDKRNGRTDESIRPRYMVWENVPGAFSSNKSEDFRIVLEETAKVSDKDASIPIPDKGKWTTAGCIVGDGWSIAWRVLDAQFWGVPQRRRRIALVADFGGHSAPEILFVRKSVSRDSESSQPKRKNTSSDAPRGVGADDIFCIDGDKLNKKERKGGSGIGYRDGDKQYTLTAKDVHGVAYTMQDREGKAGGGKGALIAEELSATLRAGFAQTLFQPIQCIDQGGGKSSVDVREGKAPTLTTTRDGAPVICLDRSAYNQGKNAKFDIGIDENGTAHFLVAKGPGAICYWDGGQVAGTLTANNASGCQRMPDKDNFNCVIKVFPEVSDGVVGTIDAHYANFPGCRGGMERTMVYSNSKTRYIVRRLTPLECERLQGYPDGWTDIGEWVDSKGKVHKTSDAARYKALGNSIALPPWKWVMKRLSACYERDATLASLFDGIGGFPLIWEQINGKGSCLWASEIEEFPIAVTKVRIGE